jgi:hypothetical protein
VGAHSCGGWKPPSLTAPAKQGTDRLWIFDLKEAVAAGVPSAGARDILGSSYEGEDPLAFEETGNCGQAQPHQAACVVRPGNNCLPASFTTASGASSRVPLPLVWHPGGIGAGLIVNPRAASARSAGRVRRHRRIASAVIRWRVCGDAGTSYRRIADRLKLRQPASSHWCIDS